MTVVAEADGGAALIVAAEADGGAALMVAAAALGAAARAGVLDVSALQEGSGCGANKSWARSGSPPKTSWCKRSRSSGVMLACCSNPAVGRSYIP